MTLEELQDAYRRFIELDPEQRERLNAISEALSDYLAWEWRETGAVGGLITSNLVCAMLAIETAHKWQEAEWKVP